MFLFAALYIVEGLCALSGLMRLPFDHFGKDVVGWSATRLSVVHVLLAIPWAIEPIFGALSDNVPLFGSRRRSYLLVSNGIAATACLALPQMASQAGVIACLFTLSLGMAASSAVSRTVMLVAFVVGVMGGCPSFRLQAIALRPFFEQR